MAFRAASVLAPPTALSDDSGAWFHANVTAVFAITMKGFCDAAAARGFTLMPRETPPPPHRLTCKPPSTALHIIASVHPNMATQWDWATPASHIARLLQPRCVCVCVWPLSLPLPLPRPTRMLTSARSCPYMAGYGLHSPRFIRGYASLLHIFFPLASAFDIALLSSWHPCCVPVGRKIKKKTGARASERARESGSSAFLHAVGIHSFIDFL